MRPVAPWIGEEKEPSGGSGERELALSPIVASHQPTLPGYAPEKPFRLDAVSHAHGVVLAISIRSSVSAIYGDVHSVCCLKGGATGHLSIV